MTRMVRLRNVLLGTDPSMKEVTLGVLFARVNLAGVPTDSAKSHLQDTATAVASELRAANPGGVDLKKLPQVAHLRACFQAVGKPAAKFPGSNEALLKRVMAKGVEGLYYINPVVDVNNAISIKSRRSVGSYDLSKLGGSVRFRLGSEGEKYPGTTRRPIDLNKLPLLADEDGPFGSPYSDSNRSLISEDTRDVMMVIFSFDGAEGLSEQLAEAGDLLATHANAQVLGQHVVEADSEVRQEFGDDPSAAAGSAAAAAAAAAEGDGKAEEEADSSAAAAPAEPTAPSP